jgi:hypothetical protein
MPIVMDHLIVPAHDPVASAELLARLLGVPWETGGHFTPVYGIAYRSQPNGPDDGRINTRLGGRNIYWNDANGHVWEILTVSYARPERPAVGAGIP